MRRRNYDFVNDNEDEDDEETKSSAESDIVGIAGADAAAPTSSDCGREPRLFIYHPHFVHATLFVCIVLLVFTFATPMSFRQRVWRLFEYWPSTAFPQYCRGCVRWSTHIPLTFNQTFAQTSFTDVSTAKIEWDKLSERRRTESRADLDAFVVSYQLAKTWPIRVASINTHHMTVTIHALTIFTLMSKVILRSQPSSAVCEPCDADNIIECVLLGAVVVDVTIYDSSGAAESVRSLSADVDGAAATEIAEYSRRGVMGDVDESLDQWFDHYAKTLRFVSRKANETYTIGITASNMTHYTSACQIGNRTPRVYWPAWPYAYGGQCQYMRSPSSRSQLHLVSVSLPNPAFNNDTSFHDWQHLIAQSMSAVFAVAHDKDMLSCPFTDRIAPQPRLTSFYIERETLRHYTNLIYAADAALTANDETAQHIPTETIEERFARASHDRARQRKLLPFERALNPNTCSAEFMNWYGRYATWHADCMSAMLLSSDSLHVSSERDWKYYLFSPSRSGLADRLTGMIGAAVITAILSGRLLVKLDTVWAEYDALMDTAIALSTDGGPDFLGTTMLPTNRYFWLWVEGKGVGTIPIDFVTKWTSAVVAQWSWWGMTNQILESPLYRQTFDDMNMTVHNLFGCLYHATHQLKVQTLLDAHVASQTILQSHMYAALVTPTTNVIGIQIRVGDDAFNVSDQQRVLTSADPLRDVDHFFHCAHQLTDTTCSDDTQRTKTETRWILNADDYVRKLSAAKRFGVTPIKRIAAAQWRVGVENVSMIVDVSTSLSLEVDSSCVAPRLLTVLKPASHVFESTKGELWYELPVDPLSASISSYRDALMDLYYFSLADHHVITYQSGFGRLPAFVSLNNRSIFSLDRERQLVNCAYRQDPLNATEITQWIVRETRTKVIETGRETPLQVAATHVSQI